MQRHRQQLRQKVVRVSTGTKKKGVSAETMRINEVCIKVDQEADKERERERDVVYGLTVTVPEAVRRLISVAKISVLETELITGSLILRLQ